MGKKLGGRDHAIKPRFDVIVIDTGAGISDVVLYAVSMATEVIVLATPEIGGLPYVVSGMVAAGGLAAALSTADGLLLTIANALSHDLYYTMIDPTALILIAADPEFKSGGVGRVASRLAEKH